MRWPWLNSSYAVLLNTSSCVRLSPQNLEQLEKLGDREFRFTENALKRLGLERVTRVNGHHEFLPGPLTVAEGHVATNLVIAIPACSAEPSNQPIPRKVPGELTHTGTTTVASVMALSSGRSSPCLSALST